MKKLFEDFAKEAKAKGYNLDANDVRHLALGPYGDTYVIFDKFGDEVDTKRIYTKEGLQKMADAYAPNFDVSKYEIEF